MEQENTADTILRFKRVFDQSSIANNQDEFPPHELPNVTAVVINEKVRDGGKDHMMYMEFDHVRQANIEITYLSDIRDMAKDYQDTGYYSRPATYMEVCKMTPTRAAILEANRKWWPKSSREVMLKLRKEKEKRG